MKIRYHYKDHLVIAVKGNNRCLAWESYEYETHKYTLWAIAVTDGRLQPCGI